MRSMGTKEAASSAADMDRSTAARRFTCAHARFDWVCVAAWCTQYHSGEYPAH